MKYIKSKSLWIESKDSENSQENVVSEEHWCSEHMTPHVPTALPKSFLISADKMLNTTV